MNKERLGPTMGGLATTITEGWVLFYSFSLIFRRDWLSLFGLALFVAMAIALARREYWRGKVDAYEEIAQAVEQRRGWG